MNDILGTRLYLAGSLFTMAEREFNSKLAEACRGQGFEVWLPQDHEPREKTAKAIFEIDVEGILWADFVVANMDGPDPDSGTCWEVGFAYGKRPIICYRTDFRNASDFEGSPYNLMLSQSATRTFAVPALDPGASVHSIASAIYHNIYHLPKHNRRLATHMTETPRFRHADK